jgi:hypothetical protein
MVRRIANDIQKKLGRVRFVSCLSPCLVILAVSLMFFSTSAISTIYTAHLQRAIAQITTATTTKPSSSNSFLTYENNSTLGIKIQYPANWQRDSYDNKVAFFAPSLGNPKIIPNTVYRNILFEYKIISNSDAIHSSTIES